MDSLVQKEVQLTPREGFSCKMLYHHVKTAMSINHILSQQPAILGGSNSLRRNSLCKVKFIKVISQEYIPYPVTVKRIHTLANTPRVKFTQPLKVNINTTETWRNAYCVL